MSGGLVVLDIHADLSRGLSQKTPIRSSGKFAKEPGKRGEIGISATLSL